MPLPEEKGPAPYAPGHAILDVIEFAREKPLPVPLTTEKLERIGIHDSYARRTMRSLEQLDLIDGDGQMTATFEAIRLAPTDQFETTLEEWFREAYKSILKYVEPTADYQKIADQFRGYEPMGMKDRMVSLFFDLAVAAGVLSEKPKKPRSASKPRTRTEPRKSKPAKPKAERQNHDGELPPDGDGGEENRATLDDARERYLELLISLAEKSPDAELLDRIERVLLGVQNQGAQP